MQCKHKQLMSALLFSKSKIAVQVIVLFECIPVEQDEPVQPEEHVHVPGLVHEP